MRPFAIAFMACALLSTVSGEGAVPQAARVQVVMLGTGTPLPDPERSGPSIAVVVDNHAYLFDAGTGVVRRAAAATKQKGIAGLEPRTLRVAFLTHLHSDHTLGLPDLILTPWTMGRIEPLELWGPKGTRAMVDGILAAYHEDITIRTTSLEGSNPTGYKVNVHEIEPGDVYKDGNITVKPFLVKHGEWKQALGYRIEASGRVIVYSGDTSPTETIVKNCHGCDYLISEAYSLASIDLVSPQWQRYRRAYHASTRELGDIVARAKPRLLILTHRGNAGCDQSHAAGCLESGSEEQMLKEMKQYYSGNVVAVPPSHNRCQCQKLLRNKSFRSGTQSIIETGLGRQGVHKRDAEHMVYGGFSFRP